MEILGKFRGEVIKYNVNKGFGFIKIKEELICGQYQNIGIAIDDALIHWKEIKLHSNDGGIAKLEVGENVTFTGKRDDKGLKAFDLKVCWKQDDAEMEEDVNYNKEEFNDPSNFSNN